MHFFHSINLKSHIMKRLLYIIISIVIAVTLTSAVQKTTGSAKNITLQSTDKNAGSESLKKSAILLPPVSNCLDFQHSM